MRVVDPLLADELVADAVDCDDVFVIAAFPSCVFLADGHDLIVDRSGGGKGVVAPIFF
jgi:hypothetical protein